MHIMRGQHDSVELIPVRNLLLVVGAVFMIIAGLLGMHTLSAGTLGHGAHAGSQAQVLSAEFAPSSGMETGVVGSGATHTSGCDGDCEGSPAQPVGHSELVMACALALLIAFSLLLPVAAVYFARISLTSTFSSLWLKYASRLPHPPSLIVLSISRT